MTGTVAHAPHAEKHASPKFHAATKRGISYRSLTNARSAGIIATYSATAASGTRQFRAVARDHS